MLNLFNMMKQAPVAPSEPSRLDAHFNKGASLRRANQYWDDPNSAGSTVRGF
jgi:hypothetical protein